MNKTPTFNDFWRIYPLKKGKEDAEKKAWNRLTADEKRKAVAAVPLYINDCQQNGIDRYKYPQGWLNSKRWRDYEDQMTDTRTDTAPSPTPSPTGVAATLLPSRGGAGVGSVTLPDGMDKW